MKSLITTLLLVITLSSTVFGDDFSDGYSAYKKGDYKTAMRLWKPLAEQGHANAQTNLGLMYDNGDGVPEDDKQAVKWYRLAVKKGLAAAQYNLGVMYFNGQGVPEDDKQAAKWFRLAAEQGYADAQSNRGDMYALGRGVPENNVLAYMWWNLAAANGIENASTGKDIITKRMTSSQIAEAQKLSGECLKKNYKNC